MAELGSDATIHCALPGLITPLRDIVIGYIKGGREYQLFAARCRRPLCDNMIPPDDSIRRAIAIFADGDTRLIFIYEPDSDLIECTYWYSDSLRRANKFYADIVEVWHFIISGAFPRLDPAITTYINGKDKTAKIRAIYHSRMLEWWQAEQSKIANTWA